MEAEVGDESEEEDEEEGDDEGLGSEDELEEDELPTAEEYLRRAPLMPRVRPEEVEVDAEAEEARLRRLYGQSSRALDETGSGGIPKGAMLMPRATDPKLWLVKCKIGRERDAVVGLLRGLLGVRVRAEAGLDAGVPASPQVFSAVCRDTLKGYIYVEAYRPADIIQAVQSLHLNHMVYASHLSKPALVPMTEMADVLSVGKAAGGASAAQAEAALPGDWVRVKRGKYSGDLAQIVEAPEGVDSRSVVKVRLLPRLSYRAGSSSSTGSKDRVPARPFDPQEASQYGPVTKSRGMWLYGGDSYKDGFLVKEVRLASLSTGAAPRPDELERFGVTGDDAGQSPRRQRQAKAAPAFAKDEHVLVIEGELKGIVGRVLGVSRAAGAGPAWLSLAVEHADIRGPVSVRADQVRRHFGVGDKVRHVQGGDTGMVVAVEDGQALFFSYLRQTQAWLSPDALQGASAAEAVSTASVPAGADDLDLDDLVQTVDAEGVFGVVVRVLPEEAAVAVVDQAGTTRTLPVASLRRIVAPPAAKATEPFRAGDRVQVDAAEGPASRAATVLQVHRSVAFCRALDTREIVVRRLGAVHAMAAYGHARAHTEPPRKGFGGPVGHLLGKSVAIVGGPHKGYIGIVKSVAEDTVRVELHTNSRMVSVHRDRVIPAGADARSHEPQRFDERGRTPAWSAAKTPGWGSSKTPAWSSSKTPAWGSARTPAHGDLGGAKTPAWNAGAARTPAWSSAGGGGKTPAWGSAQAKTPLWSSASARTPAHAAATWSAPTPAWNSAPSQPPASPSSPAIWAVPGALVRVRGSAAEVPVASASGGQVALPTGTFSLSDVEPVLPAKRDRVRLVGLAEDPSAAGTVIGLDGGDAVVRLDGSSNFRIVKLSNLVKLQPPPPPPPQ
jgi:transcription elongation factor SPT5